MSLHSYYMIQAQQSSAVTALFSDVSWRLPVEDARVPMLEALGFTSISRVDEVLVECVPPPGWTVSSVGTTFTFRKIVDASGNHRLTLMYKDAGHYRYGHVWEI